MKRLLQLFLCLCFTYGFGQECPDLIEPLNGAINVSVNTTISWNAVEGVPGYQILLGTAEGLDDIDNAVVGPSTSYTRPEGLPENTEIFVTIILNFFSQGEGGEDITCPSQSFITEDVTTPPGCTTINSPLDDATDISVFSTIFWNFSPTATDYRIIIGTAPGLDDIADENVGNITSFNPPGELPLNSFIYVRVIPFNENGAANNCPEISFRTSDAVPLPGCTRLISPLNGAINVEVTPLLEWEPVPDATGYRMNIGTVPGGNDILEDAIFTATSTFVLNFEANRSFFVTIVPFNDSGDAIGCPEENFSTILGCGPFLDPTTGEFVDLSPPIELASVFSFCENEDPLMVQAPLGADGYRWFQIDNNNNLDLISDQINVVLDQIGNYMLEAFDVITLPSGETIECPRQLEFEVVSSEIATINNLISRQTALGFEVTVEASGNGDYEYAVNTIDGPYQGSNVFRDILGTTTFFVRDINGCGIAQEIFDLDLAVEGFPKFFTPNGDNINDFWQFVQPSENETVVLVSISVFDQYGKLLKQISQDSQGWDGTYKGQPLPAGGYWFRAIEDDGTILRGNFTLKR